METALHIFDIISTIGQIILILFICNQVASNINKLSKAKTLALFLLIFADVEIFTYLPINQPTSNFFMVLIYLIFLVLFYKKAPIDAFTGFGLSYMYITAVSYVLFTFYKVVICHLSLKFDQSLQVICFIYIPSFFSYLIFYMLRKYIINFGLYIKNLKHSLIIIQIIDYTLILMATLEMEWAYTSMSIAFKAVLLTLFFAIYLFQAVYFAKINDKTKEVEMLNEVLNAKILELRKIKHDYGSEISTIYGLYQLGKYEKLGEIIRGVIERNQATSATIEMSTSENPMVTALLNKAVLQGINIVLFDKANYSNLNITDNELLRLLSNIVNNSVDALRETDNPIIRYKSYDIYSGIIVTIENNGPEIPQEIIKKIFNEGFSTKENSNNDRGFGLSIVNDILSKCGGSITVNSDTEWTMFKISIPTRK